MEEKSKPKVKAMCLFINDNRVLAVKGYDEVKDEIFYRVIGGSIEFGETSEVGVRREVEEELGCKIENLSLIKTVENIFTFNGKTGHEVVFLYKGELSNKSLYAQEKIHIIEPYGEFDAEWVSIKDILEGRAILYPRLDYEEAFR